KEAGLPISRIRTLRIQSDKPVYRFIVRCLAKAGLARRNYRRHLGALDPYGGTTWWALTKEACEYILEFVGNNGSICRYFERSFASDEMVLHTVLGNSDL